MSITMLIHLIVLVLGQIASAKPNWANTKTQTKQSIITTVGVGEGLSSSIAKNLALNSCREQAVNLNQKDFSYSALAIETEKSVAYHQEIATNSKIKNLSCEISEEEIEQKNDSSYISWILCKCDVSKTLSENVQKEVKANAENKLSRLEEIGSVSVGTSSELSSQKSIKRTIIFSFIPNCDEVLVSGTKSRIIACDKNPKEIVLNPGDNQLIFRAKGYQPKTIKAIDLEGESNAQVVLDPN